MNAAAQLTREPIPALFCQLSDTAMRGNWIAAFLAELVRVLPDYVPGEADEVAAEAYMFQTACTIEDAANDYAQGGQP